MAIYHFSGTVISRSQGRSAVACAAYRAAARLQDDYYGRLHDYTKKTDVVYAEVLLPDGAPLWMSDREQLWNAVECSEKRKDAQLSREFNFALPRELTMEQNIALVRSFVQKAFVDKGMVADLCVHDHVMADGEKQPHAHVMLTLRSVNSEGFGQKVRSWNAKDQLLAWREGWAEAVNHHLALHGHDIQVDHRTLKAQGIDLEPQYKIGASVAKERLARLEDHQRIARENGERLFNDPTIALAALTAQQSTFTHQDVARLVNRHTVDGEQFERVYAKVKGWSDIVYLGKDTQGRERFTTQGMLALEREMVQRSERLSQAIRHAVEESALTLALSAYTLTDEQRLAFDHVIQGTGLSCVVGYAGTGKSYLLGAARVAWESQGYRVLGATLSGIAAENLSNSSGIKSRTLASRFYYWDKGEQLLGSGDVLVVDEAGMIGSRQMARLLEQAEQGGAKVVLVGDPEQLQAISAGAAFRAIVERVGTVELTDIRRQRADWQKQATRELATGQTESALMRYQAYHHLHAFETEAVAQKALIENWNDARLSQPEQSQIILTYLRKDVWELNDLARQLRRSQGELGLDSVFKTERGERFFAEQDRVYFLKNDRGLGVLNGTLGTIIGMSGYQLHICLDQDERQPNAPQRVILVDTGQYPYLDHGYAATIHKAQGVTVDRSYLLASHYLDRHATYVALSRHRESVDVFYSRDVFAKDKDLFDCLSRERGKDVSLDYLSEHRFASVRGIEGLSDESNSIRVKSPAQKSFSLGEDAVQIQIPSTSAHQKDSLEALFKRYVEMELEQTRLVNEMHSSYLTSDPALKKSCSQKAIAHGKQLEQFAAQAMKRSDVRALVEQIKSHKVPHIADLGGFKAIAERLKEGICSEPDRQVLTKHLRNHAQGQSWSQDRSRDRGGRSR